MKHCEKYFELPAVKGIQAGKSYYSVMCPLYMVAKFFTYTDSSLPPDMRIQRVLNKQRIPEMKDYIIHNRDSYVFSALTASVDGEMEFIPAKSNSIGQLRIPMNARVIINDGQHRKAAIEVALSECPELRYEDISIVIYDDLGLKRSQQMFSDLNRYAVRPTKSLNILYDNRNEFSLLVKEAIINIPIFEGKVENEKSTISNRSKELFTLSGIFYASKLLVQNADLSDDDIKNVMISFWNSVADKIEIWQDVSKRKISPVEFRRDFICAHAIALKALGRLGNVLLQGDSSAKWDDKLDFLRDVDWSKSNSELQGIVIVNGNISSSHNNERAFASYLLKKSGWECQPRKE